MPVAIFTTVLNRAGLSPAKVRQINETEFLHYYTYPTPA